MKTKETPIVLSFTSPTSATTTVPTGGLAGAGILSRAEGITIDAVLSTVTTNGTLDVYLQRKVGTDAWFDWVHFPQLANGVTKRYTVTIVGDGGTITEVGGGSTAVPGVALAANTAVNVTPGGDVRVVCVAGAGTNAGVAQTITLTPYTERFG
jgi:hypothetical protein